MATVYFAGQDGFGNRGCEALVRSLVQTMRVSDSEARFFVPSRDIPRDQGQWPSSSDSGVDFCDAEPIPNSIRWWSRGRRVFNRLSDYPPKYRVTSATMERIRQSDVVVMTGGDIISLDYGLESLYYWSRICETSMDMGVPTALLGASVGPFTRDPSVENRMKIFLKRFSLITVREAASRDYLHSIGVLGAELVTDPAFALNPEAAPADCLRFFDQGASVLGFNVSPLIRKFRDGSESKKDLDCEVVSFIAQTLSSHSRLNVVLVPHVDPLSGQQENSDSAYMEGLLFNLRREGWGEDRVKLLPRGLNAAQLKDIIGRCDFFMGARTHATIAALSRCVPTTSIAYSIKAKGINQDLFGHVRYVLNTAEVSAKTLGFHLSLLMEEAGEISAQLSDLIPWRRNDAARSARLLFDVVRAANPGRQFA